MKKILFGMLLMLLILIGGLVYLGVVPVLSSLIIKPIDLGIKADAALVSQFDPSLRMKNEIVGGVLANGRDGVFEGSKPLNITVDSVQASSIFAHWKTMNPKVPLSQVQIRFNEDGSAEASGILEIGPAIVLAQGLGYTPEDIEKARSAVTLVNGNLPFYVKGTGNVKNGQVTLLPTSFQLGRLYVPDSITKPAALAVEDIVERTFTRIPGLSIKEASLQNGKLRVVGTIPEIIK